MSTVKTKVSSSATTEFKYFEVLLALFVAVLITSNIVSTKLITIGPATFVGGAVLFPLAYIFGDIFAEVYGYAKTRRVIWTGFLALTFLSLSLLLVQYLPAAPFWPNQQAYESILGFVPRIVAASLAAYVVGEFVNAYVLSRLKVRMQGRRFWARAIGSSFIGQTADTIVFFTAAFIGTLPAPVIFRLAVTAYVIKLSIEILFLPLTYAVVNFLKRKEGINVLDEKVSYNPFDISKSGT